MSETLCTLRTKGGGGGKYTETSLWTNPSPSSSFSAQTVTLSQSMSNFKYLAFKYKFNATTDTIATAIYKVEDVKNSILSGSTYRDVIGLDVYVSSSHSRSRQVGYVSDTSIQFLTSYRLNSASSDDNASIPLEILGLNELDHGKTNQTILWTNSSPTSQFAAQTVSLDLSGYDAIILKCSSLNSNTLPSAYPTHSCAQQYIPVPYGVAGQTSYRLSYGIAVEGTNSYEANRETIVTTSGVTFGGGYRNYSAGNQYAIPIQIIGVKIS